MDTNYFYIDVLNRRVHIQGVHIKGIHLHGAHSLCFIHFFLVFIFVVQVIMLTIILFMFFHFCFCWVACFHVVCYNANYTVFCHFPHSFQLDTFEASVSCYCYYHLICCFLLFPDFYQVI